MANINPFSGSGIPPDVAAKMNEVNLPQGPDSGAIEKFPLIKDFLGPDATDKQVIMFFNNLVNDLIRQMKKNEAQHRETMRKIRRGEA